MNFVDINGQQLEIGDKVYYASNSKYCYQRLTKTKITRFYNGKVYMDKFNTSTPGLQIAKI